MNREEKIKYLMEENGASREQAMYYLRIALGNVLLADLWLGEDIADEALI